LGGANTAIVAKGGKSALPDLLQNDVIIEGKDLLKVTGVSTAFGTDEALKSNVV
jgi:uncharacterized Zn-binding protein involved in type VI secretion